MSSLMWRDYSLLLGILLRRSISVGGHSVISS